MDIELFKAGCLIMIIGMGFVFFFLAIMIWFMQATSKMVQFLGKYFPEEVEENTSTSVSKKRQQSDDAQIALAIACAFAKNR